jgi:hypothetical protein
MGDNMLDLIPNILTLPFQIMHVKHESLSDVVVGGIP